MDSLMVRDILWWLTMVCCKFPWFVDGSCDQNLVQIWFV